MQGKARRFRRLASLAEFRRQIAQQELAHAMARAEAARRQLKAAVSARDAATAWLNKRLLEGVPMFHLDAAELYRRMVASDLQRALTDQQQAVNAENAARDSLLAIFREEKTFQQMAARLEQRFRQEQHQLLERQQEELVTLRHQSLERR